MSPVTHRLEPSTALSSLAEPVLSSTVCSTSLGPALLQTQAGVGFSAPAQSAHRVLSRLERGQGRNGLELGPWAKKDDAPSCWKGSSN